MPTIPPPNMGMRLGFSAVMVGSGVLATVLRTYLLPHTPGEECQVGLRQDWSG